MQLHCYYLSMCDATIHVSLTNLLLTWILDTSGNHDLEGLDEFDNDEDNLQAWMDCFHKPTPQFCRKIGEKTLMIGLSTVRFRSAPFSSHEVHVDDAQLEWYVPIALVYWIYEGSGMCTYRCGLL